MNKGCTALTHDGRPCRNWAVRDSDPPRCGSHGGGRRPAGAPYGNRNAQIHGRTARLRPVPRSVESQLAHLAAHHAFLALFLPVDGEAPMPTVPEPVLARLLILHNRSSFLLARVLRNLGLLSPAAVAGLASAGEMALRELAGDDPDELAALAARLPASAAGDIDLGK
jgi:hypothetical protein